MWEGVALLDFKNFYEAMAIKTLGHFQRKRQIDKQYRKERPEMESHVFGNLNYDKGSTADNLGKEKNSVNADGWGKCLFI